MSESTTFKILSGCAHSFHDECFPSGLNTCSVCKEEIVDAVKSLATKTSDGILNPELTANVSVDDDDDDDIFGGDNESTEETSSSADKQLKLQREIFSWAHESLCAQIKQFLFKMLISGSKLRYCARHSPVLVDCQIDVSVVLICLLS